MTDHCKCEENIDTKETKGKLLEEMENQGL